jgi:hypothetical protein
MMHADARLFDSAEASALVEVGNGLMTLQEPEVGEPVVDGVLAQNLEHLLPQAHPLYLWVHGNRSDAQNPDRLAVSKDFPRAALKMRNELAVTASPNKSVLWN